ncbi:BTAD domain-containing putative transcriptional regulator [Bailinhaonella thermotolerans]|uniref:AfsR/SARP family transcriptional regulator n=1 Tax=Bailinhaonella thermotolerans TaxID=1070861 RepID=A0A3A4AYY5_9ACTN|nr:BTAD domain-containing putative transcriptional regulator [Bailinhaonella thermotolerans]RJL32716.1 AfsR/SARP family transcriptional regulator [Bailinhaonella thermotolerans]
MRFGVLGPLAVWTEEGEDVRVPEVKVRAVLAMLLANAGSVVPADRLIEDLWDGDPPARALGTLRGKISQLRRVLEEAEPGGRELVVHRAPGYALVGAGTDVARFEELLDLARRAPGARERAAVLAEALGLWRGPAFAEFADEGFARAVTTRLEERRLTALEDLAEARLELGEHALVASELAGPVAEHPLRERLRAAHLRALRGSGRRGEALSAYAEVRERLREELGVDPGPELTAVHRDLLAEEPAPPARTNLPVPLTRLIGREEAVAEVRALLGAHRLVTLTGPGGVGKTRLARETAAGLREPYPDGVWLVELGAVEWPCEDSVSDMVTSTLGLRGETGATLADMLRPRRTLLVLDNCEHLVEPVARLAGSLLQAAPGLTILATSQEPLNVPGEVSWAVPPLELPPEGAGLAESRRASAVRLFTERAAAVSRGFALGPDNAEAIAAICRRLDGLPLALELAATRMRALTPRQLAARLDDRFALLAGGTRGAPARQQTLRAMIDWSWELCSEEERVVLRRLAVHADGCTLEAAEAVCAGGGVAPGQVLDLLARLVDRSLVLRSDGGDGAEGPRYRLLESVAAYCDERLAEAGELDRVRLRHLDYYADLASRARLRGPEQRRWLRLLDAESANARAAVEGAAGLRAAGPALRLVNGLAWYWMLRGRLDEGCRLLDLALGIPGDAPAADRAEAAAWRAGLGLLAGEGHGDPVARAREALAMFDGVEDPARRAHAEWFLAFAQYGLDDLAAVEALAARALATFRALGDAWGEAAALTTVMIHAMMRSDFASAERDGERAAALFADLGDRWGRLRALEPLAMLAQVRGDYPRARALHAEGLSIAEDLGLWLEVSRELTGLGRIAMLTGDYAEAEELHERGRRVAVEQSHLPTQEFAELGLAMLARRQGRLDEAERYLRRWLDWLRRIKGSPGMALFLAELGFVAQLRGDSARALTLHLEGYTAARRTGDPRAIALALEGLAGATALLGDDARAAALLGAAAAARASVLAPLPSGERGDVDRITAGLLTRMTEEEFAAAHRRGGRTPHEDLVPAGLATAPADLADLGDLGDLAASPGDLGTSPGGLGASPAGRLVSR